jgi:hypothetical protein
LRERELIGRQRAVALELGWDLGQGTVRHRFGVD